MKLFSKKKKEEDLVPESIATPISSTPIPEEPAFPAGEDILTSRLDMMDSSITSVRGWVEDARNKMTNLETTFEEFVPKTKDDVGEIKKNIGSMSEKVQQLMSLYEVISTQYNPFIDTSTIPAPAREDEEGKEEKEIEELLRSIAPEEFKVSGMPPSAPLPEETVKVGPLLEEEFGVLEAGPGEYAEVGPLPEEGLGVLEKSFEPSELKGEIVLKTIPGNYSSNAYAIKLLEFLIEKIGRKNLLDLLDYYKTIGWIGDESKEKFLDLASGVSVKEGAAKDWKLTPDDNLRALQFIEQIRGYPVKKTLLEEIERKAERIKE